MAWTNLPSDSLHAFKVANSVGQSLDGFITKAEAINSSLSTAISGMRTELASGIGDLSVSYAPTVNTTTVFTDPGALPGTPDFALSFDDTIDLPTSPTLAAAPTLVDPAPDFPNAPTLPEVEPTLPTAPTLTAITPAFPTVGALPTVPTFDPAPTVGTLPAMATAPAAPGLTPLLDTSAYSGAFALARDTALSNESEAVWQAEFGAAASGIGMPMPAVLAARAKARQQRRQATSEAAMQQATLQVTHLREDLRWAYESRLQYWSGIESATLNRWREEQTVKLTAWVQETSNQMELYAKQANIVLQVYQTGTQAEQSRVTALIAHEAHKLDQWVKETESKLTVWSKPTEIKAQLYQTTVQAEAARVESIGAWQSRLVDTWSKTVQGELEKYKALSGTEIDVVKLSNDIAAQRITQENARLQALLQGHQTKLQAEAEKRNWWATSNQAELERARDAAADSRALQQLALAIGQQSVTAYAAALAEQFKAWLSAASYSASTGANLSASYSDSEPAPE